MLSRSNMPFWPALGGRAVADVTFVVSTEGRNFDNLRAKHYMSQTETADPPGGSYGTVCAPAQAWR